MDMCLDIFQFSYVIHSLNTESHLVIQPVSCGPYLLCYLSSKDKNMAEDNATLESQPRSFEEFVNFLGMTLNYIQ